jgi:hypothetical protein
MTPELAWTVKSIPRNVRFGLSALYALRDA